MRPLQFIEVKYALESEASTCANVFLMKWKGMRIRMASKWKAPSSRRHLYDAVSEGKNMNTTKKNCIINVNVNVENKTTDDS